MTNQAKKADPASDRRKKTRYVISPAFPLKAVLALNDESSKASGGAWKNWTGTLVDVSASGANIQVNLAAVAFPENRCWLKLSHGSFKLEIPGAVAHFVCYARHAVCGVQFDFSNSGVEKAYHRVLEPMIMGATLAPVEGTSDSSRRHKQQFSGKHSAALTVWRETPDGPFTGFDFQTTRFGVEAERVGGDDGSARPALRFRLTSSGRSADGENPVPLSEAQEEDVRWLFRLVVFNLSTSVPPEVRKFLQSLF